MGQTINKIEELYLDFPNLINDTLAKITSHATDAYNCIAWACQYEDRWMQPTEFPPGFDTIVYWPEGAKQGNHISCLIDAFSKKGYNICDSWEMEKGFQKVALYVKKGTEDWSHASKELRTGVWSSKLGRSNDIQHSNPYTIEGGTYGDVYCFMKREFK